jgi:small redox-active disulfide protein 2
VKVQILGSGCPSCRALEDHAREAIKGLAISAEIQKVTDVEEIMRMGVMWTPALAIDGVVKSSGRILTKAQIAAYLTGAK